MLKTSRSYFVAIGIVATLITGCAVDPYYYDDGSSNAPVYRDHGRDPYYGGSPGYYDGGHRGHGEYHQRDNEPRNDWRDRNDRNDRNQRNPVRSDVRDGRDNRDGRDGRPDGARPPRNPPQQGNAQPPRPNPPPKVHDNPPPRPNPPAQQPPPRNKSDRYNPKTGQYLPNADDMP